MFSKNCFLVSEESRFCLTLHIILLINLMLSYFDVLGLDRQYDNKIVHVIMKGLSDPGLKCNGHFK